MSTILDYMVSKNAEPPSQAHPKVLKPQLDSNMGKQIMQNMESVMKSLKRRNKHKKHRQKLASKLQGAGDGPQEALGNVSQVDDHAESDEETLASLKQTWLSSRGRTRRASEADAPAEQKNAFQMLMLNGRSSQGVNDPGDGNDENCGSKGASPEVGKRRLSSGQKEQAKRRRRTNGASQPNATEVSPKSPVKKRRKKKLFECFVETVEPKLPKSLPESPTTIEISTAEESESVVEISTPSRPRRSCVATVNYADEKSPPTQTKTPKTVNKKAVSQAVANTPSTAPKVPSPVIIDVEQCDDEVTVVVASPRSTAGTPKGTGKKLAPLFLKALPKPSVDPKVREARQSFLMSDLPEKMRQDMEKKKQLQEEVNMRYLSHFPEISHIPAKGIAYEQLFNEGALFPRKEEDIKEPQTPTGFKIRGESNICHPDDCSLSAWALLNTDHQKKQLVRNLKADGDGKFPAFKFYKMLSKRGQCPDESTSTFSHKFRPTNSQEFVFNLSAVNELKEYLESFDVSPPDSASSYETDDENSNSMSGFPAARQTLVLHGDCSTGKTSAVYAIANELNFQVIEINASSKRNGSHVLNKLMEATQSHKLATQSAGKLSLSRKILRRMEREATKKSIIFIEDVDVIFAEDNGFLSAITQLMGITKRPIILTTNNRSSPNLKKTFDGAQQSFRFLKFRRPTTHIEDCLTYLHLVGVVQSCNFDPDYLRHLFDELCGRDLRRALLQMNFITLTKEIDLKWSGESQRQDIPCINLEDDGEDVSYADLVMVMDNLCVADAWSSRGGPEMQEEFQEMCLLGSGLLESRCDGAFYPEIRYQDGKSISQYTNRNVATRPSSRSASLDVEPLLRAICRSEVSRKDVQRSTSKFSHYLQRDRDLDVPVFGSLRSAKEDLEFFRSSCAVFQSVPVVEEEEAV